MANFHFAKNQEGKKTKNNTENAPLLVENPTKEEEALFAKRTRDRDQARDIQQKHGHMGYQKIINSMAKCISTPKYEQISKPVFTRTQKSSVRCVRSHTQLSNKEHRTSANASKSTCYMDPTDLKQSFRRNS